jgi:hypothetical protein
MTARKARAKATAKVSQGLKPIHRVFVYCPG